MNKEDYINEVTALIKNKTARKDVRKEIEAHIDDRTKYYLDAGYGEEESTSKAIERMGNPAEVAKDFEKLHNNELWIAICIISLFGYIAGMICGFFNPLFAYVNLVDFYEMDVKISIISVLTFCAATVSFVFAVKSKEIAVLRTYGIVSIISPLLSFSLRPAAYHFISVFTDFPAALKSGETIFGDEAFSLFFRTFTNADGNGTVKSFLIWALIILVILISSLHIITGIICLIYAKKLKNDEDCDTYENVLKVFISVLISVCIVTVIGTSAEIVRDKTIVFKSYFEDYSLNDEDITEEQEYSDSIKISVSEENSI